MVGAFLGDFDVGFGEFEFLVLLRVFCGDALCAVIGDGNFLYMCLLGLLYVDVLGRKFVSKPCFL